MKKVHPIHSFYKPDYTDNYVYCNTCKGLKPINSPFHIKQAQTSIEKFEGVNK